MLIKISMGPKFMKTGLVKKMMKIGTHKNNPLYRIFVVNQQVQHVQTYFAPKHALHNFITA